MTRARRIVVDPAAPTEAALVPAARALRAGRLVAFPTETVYGLGANALDPAAVAAIFAAKGRPADNPVIVHAADAAEAWRVTAGPTPLALRLAARFWPGPLTLVLRAAPGLPAAVTAGLPSVAVRVPDHPVALALLRLAAVPVAAPSANPSGRPSPTTAAHVLAELGGAVDLVVDGGPCAVGLESTVVDARGDLPVVLREGAITREQLAEVAGERARPGDPAGDGDPTRGHDPAGDAAPLPDLAASPGTRHRHYAPACRVVVAPPGEAVALAVRLAADGGPVGIVARDPAPPPVRGIGIVRDAPDLAARLYALLRDAEAAGVATLVVEGVPETGIGRAVMDRLRRAARG